MKIKLLFAIYHVLLFAQKCIERLDDKLENVIIKIEFKLPKEKEY